MPRIVWDQIGEKLYETGVDQVVLFVASGTGYKPGVAWNGITAVNESPSGGESNAHYADNIKYADITSAETYGATIEAFTYPPEFAVCDGSAELTPGVTIGQQGRTPFAFTYRTMIGNDTVGENYGYKIHIVYGAKAAPSSRDHGTINESPEPGAMSWEVSTTPVPVTGHRPTANLTIDSTRVDATKLAALEAILYGGDGEDAVSRLPMPDEVYTVIKPDDGGIG